MTFGSLPLAWLLAFTPAPPTIELAKYPQLPTPFSSATLLVDGATAGVAVRDQTNVAVTIAPAEYQELRVSRAFEVICQLPPNYGIQSVRAWVDSRYHLIPVTVLEYKTFNPSYIKLEIETLYLRNKINDVALSNHRIHIDFFTYPR